MKVYPIVMTQTTATVSKPIKGFFYFYCHLSHTWVDVTYFLKCLIFCICPCWLIWKFCAQTLITFWLFHDGGRFHIETSSLICTANQWTGFYMITASILKGLNSLDKSCVIGRHSLNLTIFTKPPLSNAS